MVKTSFWGKLIRKEDQFIISHFNSTRTDLKQCCVDVLLFELVLYGIVQIHFSRNDYVSLFECGNDGSVIIEHLK